MPGDYDLTLVTSRCTRCARPVSAALGELRETGTFGCVCGARTYARYTPPMDLTPFSGAIRRSSGDACHRTGWR